MLFSSLSQSLLYRCTELCLEAYKTSRSNTFFFSSAVSSVMSSTPFLKKNTGVSFLVYMLMTNLFPNSLTPHTVSPLPFPLHNLIPTTSLCKECIAQVLKYLIRAGQSGRGGESAKKKKGGGMKSNSLKSLTQIELTSGPE